jgi:hypothetical protein
MLNILGFRFRRKFTNQKAMSCDDFQREIDSLQSVGTRLRINLQKNLMLNERKIRGYHRQT